MYLARPDDFTGPSTREIRLAQQRTGCGIGPLVFAHDALPSCRRLPAPLREFRRRFRNGRIAAQIRGECLLPSDWDVVQEIRGRNDEARRAEAALLRVVIDECLHYWA